MALTAPTSINPATLSIFEGVEPGLTQSLLAAATFSHLNKGEIILRAEEPVLRYCILLEGWACLRKGNAEGQESVLHILGPNDFFPEPSRDNDNVYRANIETLSPVTVLSIPATLVRSVCERSAAFAANLLKISGQRTQQLLDHIEHLTLRDAEHRVGWFILRMRDLTGGDKHNISLPFEKAVIASYLGIKPETLSRVLQHLKQNGFSVNRNKITLPHKRALCSFCDAPIAGQCDHVNEPDCPYTHPHLRTDI